MFTELPVGLVCQLPWDTQPSRTRGLWRPRGLRPAPPVHHCPLGPSACAVTAAGAWASGWGCSRAAELREHVVHAFHTCTLGNTPTLAVSTFLRWLHRCGLGAQHPVLCATHFPNLTDGSVLQLVFSVCFFKQHFVPFFWQNIQSIYKHFLYFLP